MNPTFEARLVIGLGQLEYLLVLGPDTIFMCTDTFGMPFCFSPSGGIQRSPCLGLCRPYYRDELQTQKRSLTSSVAQS